MEKLTPSAKLTLDALNAGPGNVHELSERTGRSRSTTDKALADLAKAGLIVKVDDDGDPADGAPTRWQLAEANPADGEVAQPETTGDSPAEADINQPDLDIAADLEGEANSEDVAKPEGDGQQAEAEAPKLCRGCQTQMSKICECCWQKTPAYCGKCRRTMPQVRRGEPGEPVILSNGLPKLRPGELEELILKVMREQPLPRHTGIVGWTGGRVAIFLPGRSPSAINNALEKFSRNGVCELIGDRPMRYRLKPTDQTGGESGQADVTGTDAAQPAADATAGQPDNDA